MTIRSENNVERSVVQELLLFIDENGNDETDTGEYEFKVFVFVSRDATYLKKAFDQTEPCEDEICFYLEDNVGDLVSEQATWVRVGKNFRENPERLSSVLNSDALRRNTQLGDFFSSDSELNDLIQDGFLENRSRSIALAILAGIQYLNYPILYVGGKIGEGLLKFTKWLRPLVKFADESWNPEKFAKLPGNAGKEFEPILIPFSNEILDAIFATDEKDFSRTIDGLRASISKKKNELASDLSRFGEFQIATSADTSIGLDLTPDFVNDLMGKISSTLFDGVDFLLDLVETIVPKLEYLGRKIHNAINAFYCGLWNSLVEAVLGLVDIIAYLLVFTRGGNKFIRNLPTFVPRFFELIDEFVQASLNLDYKKIILEIVNQIQLVTWDSLAASFSETANTVGKAAEKIFSVENVAYFMGGFIGFLIDLFIGIVFTAGAATVSTITRLTSKAGKVFAAQFTRLIRTLIPKSLAKAGSRGTASIGNVNSAIHVESHQRRDGTNRSVCPLDFC